MHRCPHQWLAKAACMLDMGLDVDLAFSFSQEFSMLSGMFPSQQRMLRQAFKKAARFDTFRQRTRRSFLVAGAAAVAAAAGAFWAGMQVAQPASPAPTPSTGSSTGWLDDLASGPLPELQRQAPHLLAALRGKAADDVMWLGFHRLVLVATSQPEQEALRRMLVQVARHDDAPLAAREALEHLERKTPR
jgi:hypothetical protein